MSTIEIFGAPMSNFVRVARMTCHEKGVGYDLHAVRPHSAEMKAVSPTGRIPAMRHGDVVLFETRAICGYIDAAFPGPALIPAGAAAAAMCEQWLSYVTTTADQVLVRQYLLAYLFPGTPDGSPDRARIDAAMPKVREVMALLEAELTAHTYLGGDAFSLADIFLFPIVAFLPRAPESAELLAGSPHIKAWFDRINARASAVMTVPPPMPPR